MCIPGEDVPIGKAHSLYRVLLTVFYWTSTLRFCDITRGSLFGLVYVITDPCETMGLKLGEIRESSIMNQK